MTDVGRLTIALAVSAQLVAASVVAAHEPGFGHAVVTFPTRGGYQVDLTADAASLLARLDALAGRPQSDMLTASEYAARIASLGQHLVKQIHVRFDGVEAADLKLESVRTVASAPVDPADPMAALISPQVVITMRGTIPANARSFTWRYDLTFASYALTLPRASGGAETTLWLEGRQESQALRLDNMVPPFGIRLVALRFEAASARTLRGALDYSGLVPICALIVLPFSRRLRRFMWQPTGPTLSPVDD